MNKTCPEFFQAESAGLEQGKLNPLAVTILQEIGIDISGNETRRVFDVWKSGKIFQYVVTVCSEAEAGGCPIFPGSATHLHWPFPDPSKFTGPEAEKHTRCVMNQIQAKVDCFCEEHCPLTKA